jgi:hypothetical protein
MSEIPVHSRPRRLADWINPTGAKKVHSLVDKVYKQKNLEIAWERVQANRGSGGVDGQSLEGSPRRSISSWVDCNGSCKRIPISLNRCGRYRSRRRASRASFARWEFLRFTTGFASKRC